MEEVGIWSGGRRCPWWWPGDFLAGLLPSPSRPAQAVQLSPVTGFLTVLRLNPGPCPSSQPIPCTSGPLSPPNREARWSGGTLVGRV